MVHFQWAVLAWSLGGLVARGAGEERSHAAWRSFFSKTMLPMQRGARSGPRGCRQERSHAAWRSFFSKAMLPMQRGARSGPRGCPQKVAKRLQDAPKKPKDAVIQTTKQGIALCKSPKTHPNTQTGKQTQSFKRVLTNNHFKCVSTCAIPTEMGQLNFIPASS